MSDNRELHTSFHRLYLDLGQELTTRGHQLDAQGDLRGAYRQFEAEHLATGSEASLVAMLGILQRQQDPFLACWGLRALREALSSHNPRDAALAAEMTAVQRRLDEAEAHKDKKHVVAHSGEARDATELYKHGLAAWRQGFPKTAYRYMSSAYAIEPTTATFLSMINIRLKTGALPIAELVLRHFDSALDPGAKVSRAEEDMARRKRAEASEVLRRARAAQLAVVLASPLVSRALKQRAQDVARRMRQAGHEANRAGDLEEAHACFEGCYALLRHPADGISLANMKAKMGQLEAAREDYLDLLDAADDAEAIAEEARARPTRTGPAPASGEGEGGGEGHGQGEGSSAAPADRRPVPLRVAPPKGIPALTAAQRAAVNQKLDNIEAASNGALSSRVGGPSAATPRSPPDARAPGSRWLGQAASPTPTPPRSDRDTERTAADVRDRTSRTYVVPEPTSGRSTLGVPTDRARAEAERATDEEDVEGATAAAATAAAATAPVSAAQGRAGAAVTAAGGDDTGGGDDGEEEAAPRALVRTLFGAATCGGGSGTGVAADRPNQDSHFAVDSTSPTKGGGLVVGVLDGHGGAHGAAASQAAARAMTAWFKDEGNALELRRDAQTALAHLFLDAHTAVLDAIGQSTGLVDRDGRWSAGGPDVDARVRTPLDPETQAPAEGGTTATVIALVDGHLLLIAHVGDSDAVLGGEAIDGSGVSAEKLTSDHTPCSGTEFVRANASRRAVAAATGVDGGEVATLDFIYDSPTTEMLHVFEGGIGEPVLSLAAAEKADLQGVGYKSVRAERPALVVGPEPLPGVPAPRLAVTRSLGDAFLQTCGLTWKPEVTLLDLTEPALSLDPLVLIVGSDGLWDLWQYDEAVEEVIGAGYDLTTQAGVTAAANQLLDSTRTKGEELLGSSTDDTTCVLISIMKTEHGVQALAHRAEHDEQGEDDGEWA